MKGREEILRVHSKKVKLAEGVDLAVVARGTPGYSGAELANVINEAALLAARRGLKGITLAELEEARDKVRWGKERRSLALSEKEKTNTAYHEAGHALLLEMLELTEPLHKVTIIPRGPSLGSTMWLPLEDKYTQRRNELLDDLVVSMGGRVAEEIVFGDVTSGARGDIQMATRLARKMVCEWGMSEKMGMVEYGEHEDYVFLGRDISRARDYSEATAEQIDSEVRKLMDDAYARAQGNPPGATRANSKSSRKRSSNSKPSMACRFAKSSSTVGSINPPPDPKPPARAKKCRQKSRRNKSWSRRT